MNTDEHGWRRGAAVAVCGLLAAAGAWAQQIDVKLTLAYNAFVVGEPVVVQIDLLNATRDLIDVGSPASASALVVEITKGGQYEEVHPFRTEPFVPAFRLNPGQAWQHKLALDKWFPVEQEGKYVARVVLVHRGMRYESAKRSFDVVPGLPVGGGVQMFVKKESLKRQFKLVYWHRNQNDRLFLRIEDEPGPRIWDSIDLGALMRGTPPKLDISPDGEVTVVHRATQDAFLRTVLWSLPDSVEVVERNSLVDPEISASQRVNSLYGETGGKKDEKKPWWKFW
jgi:hypothetical protein